MTGQTGLGLAVLVSGSRRELRRFDSHQTGRRSADLPGERRQARDGGATQRSTSGRLQNKSLTKTVELNLPMFQHRGHDVIKHLNTTTGHMESSGNTRRRHNEYFTRRLNIILKSLKCFYLLLTVTTSMTVTTASLLAKLASRCLHANTGPGLAVSMLNQISYISLL